MTDNRKLDGPVKFDFDFDEAMQRIVQTNPNEVTELAEAGGEADSIDALIDQFEGAGHDNGDGDKIWFARDLQTLLGYAKWDNFVAVIDKAKQSCQQAGHPLADHFADVGKMVTVGSGAGRQIDDIKLSRYASYLVAQNGDGRSALLPSPKPISLSKPAAKNWQTAMAWISAPSRKTKSVSTYAIR